MARDSQRARVYAAENQVRFILSAGGTIEHFGSTFNVPDERKFGDVDSVSDYITKVLAFGPVAAYDQARTPVMVRERRGAAQAHYEWATSTIALPPYRLGGWALREAVVLHELAHHLTGRPVDGAHGPTFTATLIDLFEHVIDPVAAHLLRVTYLEVDVKIGRPARRA